MPSLLDELNEPPSGNTSGEEPSTGKKKGLFGIIASVFGVSKKNFVEEPEDEVNMPLQINAPSATPASGQAPRPAIPGRGPTALEAWVDERINRFDLNLADLETIEASLAAENVPGTEKLTMDINRLAYSTFDDNVFQAFSSSIQSKTEKLVFEKPPVLKHHFHPYISSDYNFLQFIQGKPCQLRIISRLPMEAFTYVRGEYLKAYQHQKNEGKWCYPDRRLQGIPDKKADPIAMDFMQFEDDFLELMSNDTDDDYQYEPDKDQAQMFALAMVMDRVPVTHIPKAEKTIELDKGSNEHHYFIRFEFKGESRKGIEAILWAEIASKAVDVLTKTESGSLFSDKVVFDPLEVNVAAKKQLFDIGEEQVVKKAIDQIYDDLEVILDIDLTLYEEDEAENEHDFRKAVIAAVMHLSKDYNAFLLQKNKKHKIGAGEMPPKPITVND